MGERLQPQGEYQTETQDISNDFPPFDPENARALKSEAKNRTTTEIRGLAVGAEEAREIGKMSLESAVENNKIADESLKSGLTSGEITRVDVGPEQQIEANREAFFDIQKRRAFIAELYPVLTESRNWDDPELNAVPDSVRREFSFGGSIIRHMTEGSPVNVSSQKMLKYESGIILSEYHSREDMGNMLAYEKAKEINDKIFDQDALESFQPKDASPEEQKAKTAALIDKIRSEKTLDGLDRTRKGEVSEMFSMNLNTNIEVAKQNDATSREVTNELMAQENQIRHDESLEASNQQQATVEKIKAEQARLEEEYKNANLFKRAKMLASGYRSKMRTLESDLKINSNRASVLRSQYENMWKNWDSDQRKWAFTEE